ncbi:MAG: superoxide dismutase family protein [Ginsengibacter sp.]
MKQLLNSLKLAVCASSFLWLASCNSGNTTETTTTDSTSMMDTSPAGMDTTSNMSSTDTSVHHVSAVLSGVFPDTTVTGNVQFDADNGKVKMKLELMIPTKANKSVAVHIHEKGDCGDMGKAAGGHWNPTGANHGKWGGSSYHLGDIGNVKLDSKGAGTMEMETDLWTIGGDEKSNIVGKSIIVHGGVDDFVSQPSGNAGTRIGCGIIK